MFKVKIIPNGAFPFVMLLILVMILLNLKGATCLK